jgi:hypothetical protein
VVEVKFLNYFLVPPIQSHCYWLVVLLLDILQLKSCLSFSSGAVLPGTILLLTTSFRIIIMLKKPHCLPGVPDRPVLLLSFICCLQKTFLRPLAFHLTAPSANQKKSTTTEVEAHDIHLFFLMFSASDFSQFQASVNQNGNYRTQIFIQDGTNTTSSIHLTHIKP